MAVRYYDLIRDMKNAFNHRLRLVQYARQKGLKATAREVRSGLQFLAYASRRSAQASTLFAQRLQVHLQRCGVNLRDLTWQIPQSGTANSSANCSPTVHAPTSPLPSLTSARNMSASPPLPTPTRATSKPSTASSRRAGRVL